MPIRSAFWMEDLLAIFTGIRVVRIMVVLPFETLNLSDDGWFSICSCLSGINRLVIIQVVRFYLEA
jgi:hypothetical protein